MLFNRYDLLKRAKSFSKIAMDSMEVLHESLASETWFDIFLSHKYEDREEVTGLAEQLINEFGYKVYIDWIVDPSLDRQNVNKKTAEVLRNRLKHSKCLWYVTSSFSANSKWMPWEAGFADGHTGNVAICPLAEGQSSDFKGLEYLSLYPYVDIARDSTTQKNSLWINESQDVYCSFNGWLNEGKKPSLHK